MKASFSAASEILTTRFVRLDAQEIGTHELFLSYRKIMNAPWLDPSIMLLKLASVYDATRLVSRSSFLIRMVIS